MQPVSKRGGWLALIADYTALLVGGWYTGHGLVDFSIIDVRPLNEPMVHAMIMTAARIFVLASATPFVPGAEIGFGLFLVFRAKIALLVYVCIVSALVLAYLVGGFVPASAMAVMLAYISFTKARDLVMYMASLDTAAHLDSLAAKAPHWVILVLLRHRYLVARH
jgi:hypothetical protein